MDKSRFEQTHRTILDSPNSRIEWSDVISLHLHYPDTVVKRDNHWDRSRQVALPRARRNIASIEAS
jgi:hypothetical protein